MIRSTIHGLISHVLRGVVNHNQGVQLNSCLVFRNLAYLVGGLEHEFYFSIYWEFHHPNWLIYFSIWLKPPTRHYLTMSKTGTMNRGFALGMRKNYRKTDWKASWIIFNHRIFCSWNHFLIIGISSHFIYISLRISHFSYHFLENFPFLAGYLIIWPCGHTRFEFTPFRPLFRRPGGHRIFRSLSLVVSTCFNNGWCDGAIIDLGTLW